MSFLGKTSSTLSEYFVPSEKNSYRPRSLRRDFLISIVALVCVVEGFLATSLMLERGATQFSAAVLNAALISLTNDARAQENKDALVENATLRLAAQAKANDMASRGYFSHKGPDGKQPWAWMHEAGYDYAYAGENLAAHFYDSSDVVGAWLKSPSHRENILRGNYTEIGIGIAHGKHQGVDTVFVVQFFGVSKQALGVAPTRSTAVASVEATVSNEVPTSSVAEVEALEVPEPAPNQSAVVDVPAPTVAGESTSGFTNSVSKLLSSPRIVAMWMLFALLFLIASSIALAFFIRIRIQAVDLLINGMVVAAFVLTILASNSYFFSSVDLSGSSASAISAFAE